MRWLAATISLKRVGDLAFDAEPVARHADREVADPHRLQRGEQFVNMEDFRPVGAIGGGLGSGGTLLVGWCFRIGQHR